MGMQRPDTWEHSRGHPAVTFQVCYPHRHYLLHGYISTLVTGGCHGHSSKEEVPTVGLRFLCWADNIHYSQPIWLSSLQITYFFHTNLNTSQYDATPWAIKYTHSFSPKGDIPNSQYLLMAPRYSLPGDGPFLSLFCGDLG